MQGNEIFSLKNKHLALHKSFKGVDPHGKEIFEVKGHFSRKSSSVLSAFFDVFSVVLLTSTSTVLSSKSSVHFLNAADGREVELQINGDWFDRSADITCAGQTVAHIGRSFFNVREIFADKQTYFVKVAPGVDLTLIAALCVCLDEKENEK